MTKLKGLPLAIVAVALAESIDFMMSATAMHTPPFMVARYVVKIVIAGIILMRPRSFCSLLSRKGFCVALAVSGCAGALLLFVASETVVIMAASILVSGSETCLFVSQALILFAAARQDILKAAMAGILLAFGITVVSFALPEGLSLIMQVIAVCLLSVLAYEARYPASSEGSASASARAPIIPWSLVAVLVLFSFGTQFAFIFGDIDCDWAMVFALGAFAGAGIMVLEFRVFSSSRISTLDITCALFIAVPVMLVGMGHASSGVFMSLVNIGNCLFLPRMLQVILRASEEDRVDPVRGVCLAYIIVTVSVMLATLLGIAGVLETPDGTLKTIVSIAVAVGCIFSAFILYSARVRDDAFEYIRTNERDETRTAQSFLGNGQGGAVSPDAVRRIADELYLTRRETEVLALLLEGCELEEVGGKLCISMSTVKTHVLHIYQKFDVHSRRELIEAAVVKASCQG